LSQACPYTAAVHPNDYALLVGCDSLPDSLLLVCHHPSDVYHTATCSLLFMCWLGKT
jgi:hypothetical protein